MAPLLFKLATRKHLSVKDALSNVCWMMDLQRINTEEQMDRFIELWSKIQLVNLSDARDSISWNLTTDGSYSASSVYAIQLCARVKMLELNHVWSIRAEGKVKFFFWLFLQNRIWTADRLSERGWPHDDKCSPCDQHLETAAHLVVQVWNAPLHCARARSSL
jgi:hypothetical protein